MTKIIKKIIVACSLLLISAGANAQKIIYGINVDKEYPDIKEFGTSNLEKEVVLKDKSLFYFVKISHSQFVFGAIGKKEPTIFDTWNHPEKFYYRGLNDVKKVFGEPINIFLDSAKTKKTTDFYLWKVKRDNGFFIVYYSIGYANRGLTLNIAKWNLETDVNREIVNTIYAEQRYRHVTYIYKPQESNLLN